MEKVQVILRYDYQERCYTKIGTLPIIPSKGLLIKISYFSFEPERQVEAYLKVNDVYAELNSDKITVDVILAGDGFAGDMLTSDNGWLNI